MHSSLKRPTPQFTVDADAADLDGDDSAGDADWVVARHEGVAEYLHCVGDAVVCGQFAWPCADEHEGRGRASYHQGSWSCAVVAVCSRCRAPNYVVRLRLRITLRRKLILRLRRKLMLRLMT